MLAKESEIPDDIRENKKIIFWNLTDPYQKGYEVSVTIRDQIKGLIEANFK